MNAAMQVPAAAMLASGSRSVPQPSQHASGVDNFHELWKSVFERSRPVEASLDGASAGERSERFNGGGDSDNASPGHGAAHGAAAHSSADLPIEAPSALTRISANPPLVGTTAMATERGVSADTVVVAATWIGQQARMLDVASNGADARAQSGGRFASTTMTATASPARAESINVFVQGAAVSIVVRDTGASTEEALHCAFETARELTGQRAALQRLTLNGRILYQQQGDAVRSDLTPFSALAFAC